MFSRENLIEYLNILRIYKYIFAPLIKVLKVQIISRNKFIEQLVQLNIVQLICRISLVLQKSKNYRK